MAIEQWGFFSVPYLLWHGTSVYNGHIRRNRDIHSYTTYFNSVVCGWDSNTRLQPSALTVCPTAAAWYIVKLESIWHQYNWRINTALYELEPPATDKTFEGFRLPIYLSPSLLWKTLGLSQLFCLFCDFHAIFTFKQHGFYKIKKKNFTRYLEGKLVVIHNCCVCWNTTFPGTIFLFRSVWYSYWIMCKDDNYFKLPFWFT